MESARLQDVFNRGMGSAAKAVGDDYDVYRPFGRGVPLSSSNRIMRLPILLDSHFSRFRSSRGFDRVLRATCDGISLRAGDYLVGPRGILFVAAMPLMETIVCVLTNRMVKALRPLGPPNVGLNSYSGLSDETLTCLFDAFPARFDVGTGGAGTLPGDGGRTVASVLLPVMEVEVRASDLLQDEVGRRFVIRSCEFSDLGCWASVGGTEI